jgi:predicted metal-dependent hydrolase
MATSGLSLFRHQRSNREVRLGAQAIGYELKLARRRTIGFTVGTEGLAVSAPRGIAQADIDRALQIKAAWILRKLAEQGERLQRQQAARVVWADGVVLPYLGAPLTVRASPALRAPAQHDAETATLHLRVPAVAAPERASQHLRDLTQRWLQRQALDLFVARCRHWAPALGVQIGRLRLSAARTRWGSASADGTVRLNWRLVHFDLATIDYVVVHELAHLREMNHSPAFWAIVRSAMPDYEARRQPLKDGQVPVFD